MTFDDWWDSTRTVTPDTYQGWEASCRAAWYAGARGPMAELAALRELMNVYNVGGWTDAVGPMRRALAAEAELTRLRAENDRLYAERRRDALDGQAALDEANNEVVRLRAELERVTRERDEYRGALQDVRANLHAMGRRPEHCWEMSVIDAALTQEPPA